MTMNKNLNRIVSGASITAALGVSAFFLLRHLHTIPFGLNGDEAINGTDALHALDTHSYQLFYPKNFGREGLFINLAAASIHAFGASTFALRLPSVLAALATLLGLAFLVKHLTKSLIASAISVALLGTSLWFVIISRDAYSVTLCSAAAVWTTYFGMKMEDSWQYALPAALTFGLGWYTYLPFRAFLIVLLPILIAIGLKKQWGRLATFLAGGFALALPLIIYFLRFPGEFNARTGALTNTGSPILRTITETFGILAGKGAPEFSQNFNSMPLLGWVLTVLLFVGVLFSFLKLKLHHALSLLLWCALGAVAMGFAADSYPYFLRFFIAVPAVFAYIGLGAYYLARYCQKLANGTATMFLGAIVIVFFAGRLIMLQYNFSEWSQNPITNDGNAEDFGTAHNQIGEDLKNMAKPVYVITSEEPTNQTEGIAPSLFIPLYHLGAYDYFSAFQKGVYIITPLESSDIPPGAQVIYY